MANRRETTQELPVELLHAIFRFTLPPVELLDPTPSRGPRSPWMRMMAAKRALAQVSKHWHSVALTFLYEDICFRYSTQVSALAATFRGNPTVGCLVKTIVVDCPVTSEMRDAFVLDLAHILSQCTALRTIIFTDSAFAMEDDLRRVALYPFPVRIEHAIKRRKDTLQRFEQWPLGGTPHFTMPVSCITPATRLRVLAINVDHPSSLESVTLPALEELDLSQEYDVPRLENMDRFLSWTLPRLRILILPMATRIQGLVLKAHGRALEYLEFRDHLELGSNAHAPYCDYIHLCPALRHLVFVARSPSKDLAVLNRLPAHPTLAFVDMWVNSPAEALCAEFIERRAARKLATDVQWKNVRLLDRALSTVVALPRLFPPDTPETDLPSTHSVPGLAITHTTWGVYRSDLNDLFPLDDSSDEYDVDEGSESARSTSDTDSYGFDPEEEAGSSDSSEDEDGLDADVDAVGDLDVDVNMN